MYKERILIATSRQVCNGEVSAQRHGIVHNSAAARFHFTAGLCDYRHYWVHRHIDRKRYHLQLSGPLWASDHRLYTPCQLHVFFGGVELLTSSVQTVGKRRLI